MANRSRSIGLISLFLLLSACGGGGGQTLSSDDQSKLSGTNTSTTVTTTDTNTTTQAGTLSLQQLAAFYAARRNQASTSSTLSLQWAAPAARSNGDSLSLSEIDSYTIYFGTSVGDYPYTVAIEDASTTNLDIPDLPSDTYYLVITVTDRAGRESGYSSVVVKEVT